MKRKLLVLVTILLLTAVLFTACVPKVDDAPPTNTDTTEESPPAGEKILRTNNLSEPGSLDPALAQGTHESWVLDHTFEGLMKIDKDMKIVPGMAKDYTLSDDDLTSYVMTLNGQMEILLQLMTLNFHGREHWILN